jgi:hypothetical protein
MHLPRAFAKPEKLQLTKFVECAILSSTLRCRATTHGRRLNQSCTGQALGKGALPMDYIALILIIILLIIIAIKKKD